jgi:hypothetical protein
VTIALARGFRPWPAIFRIHDANPPALEERPMVELNCEQLERIDLAFWAASSEVDTGAVDQLASHRSQLATTGAVNRWLPPNYPLEGA